MAASPPRLPAPHTILIAWMAPSLVLTWVMAAYGLLVFPPDEILTTALWTLAALTGLSVLGNLVLQVPLLASLRRTRRALAAGATLETLDPEDLRRATTLHRPLAALILGWWLLGALVWIPISVTRFGTSDLRTLLLLSLEAACLGFHAAVATYYLLHLVSAFRIAPVLLADGRLDRIRARRERVWGHVVALAFALGVMGPVTSWAFLEIGAGGTKQLLFVSGVLALVGVVQTAGIVTTISRPAGDLLGKMRAVRDGSFEVRTPVRSVDTFGELASGFNEMVEGLAQREFLRETFGRYLSPQVAELILGGSVELGGETREATVLFSDIRGFTRMSETMDPPEVVAFLNDYLDAMVECVFEHSGMVDKFIGDAILAVFGAPVSAGGVARDARNALACAVAMSQRLDRLNAARKRAGEAPIEIGIGVHTGPLVAGNIGSRRLMNYTVVGDTVNVASRIESATKRLGARILLSEQTARHAPEDLPLAMLEEISLRNRAQPVRLYALDANAKGAAPA
ncbi:MAG: adenylate/guanylate cyclase domain-containing protein [Deltaproteobacteria bacterium]|nr:MAG: adenylate/guanylate cyclase domain-containing protein [Deltaproteobacteria bacterium]